MIWDPPLKIGMASDINMPHLWLIFGRLAEPLSGGSKETLAWYLAMQALYTWREAFIGFALGGLPGDRAGHRLRALRIIERALVPYVVASQTIPIVALAPLIIYLVGHNVSSVVIIATYLSFYPVTIAMLRGLRTPDPRALELMRSYAASRWAVLWKVRFPASLPYLFTALKITATASIVGAIVGEGPGGIQAGLGRAILFFAQQYTVGAGKAVGRDPVHGPAGHHLLRHRARRRGANPARAAPRRPPDDGAGSRESCRQACRHRQVIRRFGLHHRGAARHQPGDRTTASSSR